MSEGGLAGKAPRAPLLLAGFLCISAAALVLMEFDVTEAWRRTPRFTDHIGNVSLQLEEINGRLDLLTRALGQVCKQKTDPIGAVPLERSNHHQQLQADPRFQKELSTLQQMRALRAAPSDAASALAHIGSTQRIGFVPGQQVRARAFVRVRVCACARCAHVCVRARAHVCVSTCVSV